MGETNQTTSASTLELEAARGELNGLFSFEASPMPTAPVEQQPDERDVSRLAGSAIDRTPAQSDAVSLAEITTSPSPVELPPVLSSPDHAVKYTSSVGVCLSELRKTDVTLAA